MNKKEVLVSIIVLTFNQEDTIKRTLESLLYQKDVTYEIIVSDDHSVDKTYSILKKYSEFYSDKLFIFRNESNIGVVANYWKTVARCSGKYITVCAGDDWWCDNYKLKKQIQILESNLDIGCVCTNMYTYKNGKQKKYIVNKSLSFSSLLKFNSVCTLTTCIRYSLLKEYCSYVGDIRFSWVAEDYPIVLWLSIFSKIVRIDDLTAVYNINDGSISNPIGYNRAINYQKGISEIRLFFAEKTNFLIDEVKDVNFRNLMYTSIIFKRKKEGISYYNMIIHKTLKDFLKKVLFLR